MSKNSKKKKNQKQYIGIFSQDNGASVTGDLKLNRENTRLTLHCDTPLETIKPNTSIKGTAYTGEHITLIDCFSPGVGHIATNGKIASYNMEVFPHFVAIGNRHLESETPYISSITFSTNDLACIFYDFDAFSRVIRSKELIDVILEERRGIRPVESGDQPIIAYFTGKTCIIEIATAIGKFSVHHRPSYNMGDPKGVYIKNKMIVSIEPESCTTLDDAIDRMHQVVSFLSLAAGRAQEISNININTHEASENFLMPISIMPNLSWRGSSKTEHLKPHPGDVPLNPIGRQEEFHQVLSNWIERNQSWRIARARYLECLKKGHKYDTDRLVAAANMFDILPQEAVPLTSSLSDEMTAARNSCRALFRKLPNGIDRSSALDALGRLGKPSLPKKISYRISLISAELDDTFPELQFVASVAVKCRNLFVHGSSGDIDYSKVEPFMPFLTDSLEFIFACSDLIDAGWDAKRWNSDFHGWGHSFARYRSEYIETLAELKRATQNS